MPKFTFISCLVMQNRLSKFDRMKSLEPIDGTCILGNQHAESKLHLFFSCSLSKQIWEHALLLLGHPIAAMDWNFELNWTRQNKKKKSLKVVLMSLECYSLPPLEGEE